MRNSIHVTVALVLTATFVVAHYAPDTKIYVKSNWKRWMHGVDPAVNMNVTQLITSNGYPCEEHDVITSDGYILSIQRIPFGRHERMRHASSSRPVVLVQHGLLSSSADWVDNLVNQSLGFLLADAGFDVWLGNSRGNTYGVRHRTLNPNTDKFWDFSWDEMAAFDLPATIQRILSATGARDLVYIGFSQGTEIAFARLSEDRELSKKIRLFVALAPVAYIGNIESPIRFLAPFSHDLSLLFRVFGVRDFLPSDPIMKWIGREVCGLEIPSILCENVLFLFGGYDYKQMNSSRIPVYVSHTPAGTSVRNIVHYAQSIESGKFQKFDFGSEENVRRYNQTTPPTYYPGNITVPVALYSATDDWLADTRDVQRLATELRHVAHHKIIPGWEHLDFTWAIDSPTACYNDAIDLIKRYYNIA